MNEHHFDKTKGQSAIEYLMTYGWMLLVVAIVGGAIFATVQGQCTQSTSGFSGSDVIVENFGTDSDGNIQMTLRNGGAETLEISDIAIGDHNANGNLDGTDNLEINESDTDIGVGNSRTFTVQGDDGGSQVAVFESSDGCNDFDLSFQYTMGELTDQVTSGTLTDSIEFSDDLPSA